jgi:hypothetical protein
MLPCILCHFGPHRNRYVALNLAKPSGAKRPLAPYQKPCKHMAEAIVVDGTERVHTVNVWAEPGCAVHFADRGNKALNPEQLAREREQRRKELEKHKLEITIRHRALAEVIRHVTSPLECADLVLIANAMLEKSEPLRSETLARRHKLVDGSASEVTDPQVQKGLQRHLRQLDESGLSKLIVEIILLGGVESPSQEDPDYPALISSATNRQMPRSRLRFHLRLRPKFNSKRPTWSHKCFISGAAFLFPLLPPLDIRHSLYGYIGTEDFTLFPLIRPGSFVQIDGSQNRIGHAGWSNEHDRPIYFVELRDGYACSWCELKDRQLLQVPCPQSRTQSGRYGSRTTRELLAA